MARKGRRSFVGVDREQKRFERQRRQTWKENVRDVHFVGSYEEFQSDRDAPLGFTKAEKLREAYNEAVRDGAFVGTIHEFMDDRKAPMGFRRADRARKKQQKTGPETPPLSAEEIQAYRSGMKQRSRGASRLSGMLRAASRTTMRTGIGIAKRATGPWFDPQAYAAAIRSTPIGAFAMDVIHRSRYGMIDRAKTARSAGVRVGARGGSIRGGSRMLASILSELRTIRKLIEKSIKWDPKNKVYTDSDGKPVANSLGRGASAAGLEPVQAPTLASRFSKGMKGVTRSMVPTKIGPAAQAARVGGGGAVRAIGGQVVAKAAMAAKGIGIAGIITAILSLFLPDDIKSFIGDIFNGLLKAIGLDKSTIDMIFAPFRFIDELVVKFKEFITGALKIYDTVRGYMTDFFEWLLGKKAPDQTIETKKDGSVVVNKKPGDVTSAESYTYKPGETQSVEEKAFARKHAEQVKKKEELLAQVVSNRKDLEGLMFSIKKSAPNSTPQQLGDIKQNIEVLKMREEDLTNEINITRNTPPKEVPDVTKENKKHALIEQDIKRAETIVRKNISILTGKEVDAVPVAADTGVVPEPANATPVPGSTKFYGEDGKELVSDDDQNATPIEGSAKFYDSSGQEIDSTINAAPIPGSQVFYGPDGKQLSSQSESVEHAREDQGDINTIATNVDNSKMASKGQSSKVKSVPSTDAQRGDLDDELFFSAAA